MTTLFFDSIKKKYQRGKQIDNYLKIIKENILSFEDFGTITINSTVFENKNELEIQITHEVRHLLHFLVRLNLICWNAFQHFSQIDFNNDISKELLNVRKYLLDENEFVALSSTYIDRLVCIYKQYYRTNNYDEKKLLIQTILVLADVYPKIMLKDLYWIDVVKNNNSTTEPIVTFFRELFLNHKQQKIPGNTKSDKCIKLMKWTLNQFENIDE